MTNAQKTPLSSTLPAFVRHKIHNELSQRGQALPGHVVAVNGAIVTVNFDMLGSDGNPLNLEQATMPVAECLYARPPIQVGDKGVAIPANVYIGGVSGLGSGPGDRSLPPNLSALIWFPVGNVNWAAVDPNAYNITGLDAINLTAPVTSSSDNLVAGNGASGSFTTPTGQTVTVQDGIIVNIY